MKCARCKQDKPPEDFVKPKGGRSSVCAACRRFLSNQHRRNHFARMDPDKRHSLGAKRRAEAAGVASEMYSRLAIFARWGWKCGYCCDRPAEHLDHVVALALGGDDVEANLIPACAEHNLQKGAKSLLDWALADPNISEIGA